jgi:hypothetical protein
MKLGYYLKTPLFWIARIPGINYTGYNYRMSFRQRLGMVILGLIEVAQGLVTVLSFGTFSPDWSFNWVFSDMCSQLGDDDSPSTF